MELAKLLEHNAQSSALTPRGQLRVAGAPRTLRVLIRQLRILREEMNRPSTGRGLPDLPWGPDLHVLPFSTLDPWALFMGVQNSLRYRP
jgi:hypothetical protein